MVVVVVGAVAVLVEVVADVTVNSVQTSLWQHTQEDGRRLSEAYRDMWLITRPDKYQIVLI